MPGLTFINGEEEDIEEQTDEQRAQGHLPSEGCKEDIEYSKITLASCHFYSEAIIAISCDAQTGHRQTHRHTHTHTRAGSGSAPLRL